MSERTAYLGLGSNLDSTRGSPAQTLRAALKRLETPARGVVVGRIGACSSLYETDPVGNRAQPPFLNAAAALKTELDPRDLLEELLAIEREFGRDRDRETSKGPRTLDLDLLLLDDLEIDTPGLTLPHPALSGRRFVLAPLAEIAPELRPPGFNHTVAELLALLPDEGDNRIASVRRSAAASRS